MMINAPAGNAVLLGNQTVQATQDGGQSTSEAFGYTASVTGTATSISVYLDSTDGVQLGLYTDKSSKPGVRLDKGSVSTNAAGWVTVPLTAGVQIASGTRYWIAIAATGNTTTVGYRDTGWSGMSLDYSGSGLDNPYGIQSQWSSNPASVYVGGSTSTPPPPVAPADTVLPAISGTAQQGDVLTASIGGWTGTAPITYTYQWQQGGTINIANATSSSYTASAGDVGHTLDVVVTAKNAAGGTSAKSAATAAVVASPPPPVPTNTTLEIVSGTATQGQPLATTNGSWTGTPTGYAYQWRDCDTSGSNCTSVTGATSGHYMLASGDVGHMMRVVVTATNGGGSTPATSLATVIVASAPISPPSNSGSPVISGTPQQGQTLIVSNGSWTGTPTSYSVRWSDGTKGSSDTLAAVDVGQTVTATVTATNSGGSASATSAGVGPITASGVGGLPPGVTLQPIDGGAKYFSQFSNASGFDSAGSYPIGVWDQTLGYNSSNGGSWDPPELAAYKAIGVNGFISLYNGYNQSMANAIQADGMWQIDGPPAPSYLNAQAGNYWFDEIDSTGGCQGLPSASVLGETVPCVGNGRGGAAPSVIAQVTADLHGAHGAGDPSRFVYGNYTTAVPNAPNNGISVANAQAYSKALDVVSFDYYAISGAYCCGITNNVWAQYDMVQAQRALVGNSRPVWFYAEAGNPFSSYWSGITATPAMEIAEAWNGIIGGARGVTWFDHDFGTGGGWSTSSDDLIDTNPAFAPLQAAVRAFDQRVTSLAPILNEPFSNGYVTSNGSMNVMAKYDSGSGDFYVFAAPRSNSSQNVTFTVAGGYTGPVTVQGENRTVQATNGVFTDTFANQTAVHIYQIP